MNEVKIFEHVHGFGKHSPNVVRVVQALDSTNMAAKLILGVQAEERANLITQFAASIESYLELLPFASFNRKIIVE
jgi:hypothetical protein